ncbi:nuclear transport factor 2 family protein [Rhodococcus sp. USK10]|uniref:nuclear transport factor 2 family protein n=1 Tax=Rhodococcus TaxID=1827 RepID=UPI000F58919F|nr:MULTISPECIES: nuclear transport factor 2 family protein [Rhodococcus]QYB04707.1 nuclear transport factor 2 family protein [Rhodococcus sp. USK10]
MTKSIDEARETVRTIYQAFNSADLATIEATVRDNFAPEVVVREPESLPWGGVYEGRDLVMKMMAGLTDPTSPIDAKNLVVDQLFASTEGDTIHIVADASFPWHGATSSIPMRALEWFSLRKGKVVEVQVFLWDAAAALAALGSDSR